MKRTIIFLITLIAFKVFAAPDSFKELRNEGRKKIVYGIYEANFFQLADLIFVPEYGDSFIHHEKWFRKLNQFGIRVIGFDLPSHGATRVHGARELNGYRFKDILQDLVSIENETNQKNIPLILSGWSLGGLASIRLVQNDFYIKKLKKKISGLVLMTPALTPKPCPGNKNCTFEASTQTHDEAIWNKTILPKTYFEFPLFALDYFLEAQKAWVSGFPTEVPIVQFYAKDDFYVSTSMGMNWTKLKKLVGTKSLSFLCPDAYHDVLNENAQSGGSFVQNFAAAAALAMALGREFPKLDSSVAGACDLQKF